MQINWSKIGDWCKKYLLNKYSITLLVFFVVIMFVGDQSLLERMRRAHQIHLLERRLEQYHQGTKEAERELIMLQNPDSLEKYAREKYYMHTPDEDVYVVPEK
ncbi:MAG: septum formation initiator family protein [Paludibacteraceae bacterium]|nr:septum formation initiator family protein [Paludibacteraceae bacterium]